MTVNLIIQYALVGLALIGALVWIVIKLVKLRKMGKEGGDCCCGCSMSQSCGKKNTSKPKKDCCQ